MAAARIYLGLQDTLWLGNLDVSRDWGYAADYVESMWLMLQTNDPQDFVIGTGHVVSVREFAAIAFGYLGLDPNQYISIDPKFVRPIEMNTLVSNPSKARQILGWEPKTTLRELVISMVESDLQSIRDLHSPIARIQKAKPPRDHHFQFPMSKKR